jgi:hypothetical protein
MSSFRRGVRGGLVRHAGAGFVAAVLTWYDGFLLEEVILVSG